MTATPSVIASFIKKQEKEASNEYNFEYNRKFLISTCESINESLPPKDGSFPFFYGES